MTTKPARKDRLGDLRKEIQARFGTGADVMPRVSYKGGARLYPMYQIMTIAECETALSSGLLPDPAKIAASGTDTRTATSAPVVTVNEKTEKPAIRFSDVVADVNAAWVSKQTGDTSAVWRVQNDNDSENGTEIPMIDTTATARMIDGDTDDAAALAEIMARMARKNPGAMDENRVRAIIAEMLKESGAGKETLSITVGDLPAVDIDGQHESFPLLLAVTAARVPCMLVGPAGSGKTSGAHAAAKALNLPFYCMSVGPQTSKSDFKGFRDANGTYHRTPLREAYEGGGIFLLDEIDAGNPGVITELNACLANDGYTFADGTHVTRHADFIPVAAANTFGTGADRQYVGRNQLDAATLDRFFILEWGYDEAFEASLIGLKRTRTYQKPTDSGMTPEQWYSFVTSVRAGITSAKIRHVVSPRATIYGARLLRVIPREKLEEGLIWKGLPKVQRDQIKAGGRN